MLAAAAPNSATGGACTRYVKAREAGTSRSSQRESMRYSTRRTARCTPSVGSPYGTHPRLRPGDVIRLQPPTVKAGAAQSVNHVGAATNEAPDET